MYKILYEDPYYIIVNKSSGLLTHKSKIDYYEEYNLCDSLSQSKGMILHPLNRLDKATSGIIVLVREEYKDSYGAKFFHDLCDYKNYIALVRGIPGEGALLKEVPRDKNDNYKIALSKYQNIKQIKTILSNKRHKNILASLVKIKINDGKYHQIRKHLATINHPILGDANYGDNILNKNLSRAISTKRRLMLHCYKIAFYHWKLKKNIIIRAKLNDDFSKIYNEIKQPDSQED